MKVVSIKKKLAPPWRDPRSEDGALLLPEHLSKKNLDAIKKTIGSFLFAGQYQQSPRPAEGTLIKEDWFKIWEKPKPPKVSKIFSVWDCAFKAKEQNDYSVCTTWGIFDSSQAEEWLSFGSEKTAYNTAILLSLWRGRVGYPELRKRAFLLAQNFTNTGDVEKPPKKSNQPDLILIEDKASGQSLIQDFYASGINNILPVNPKGDKVQRFHLVSTLIENGLIYLARSPKDKEALRPSSQTLLDEVLLFPKGKHDDIVDTLVYFLQYAKDTGILKLTIDPRSDDSAEHQFSDNDVGFF